MGLVYSKDTSVSKTDKDLCRHGAYILLVAGKSTINMNIEINKLYCMIEGDRCYEKKKAEKTGRSGMHGSWAVCNFKQCAQSKPHGEGRVEQRGRRRGSTA